MTSIDRLHYLLDQYRFDRSTNAEQLELSALLDTIDQEAVDEVLLALALSHKTNIVSEREQQFTLNDANGHAVKLSNLRGKYVLVDFWASWCMPCRKENPNLVDAYNKFKDRNFIVLGVALERPGAKDAWLSAMEKDGLPWTGLTDFNYFNSPVAKMYGVESIPQNFLIDPSGKIIALGLRGEALQIKLKEILN